MTAGVGSLNHHSSIQQNPPKFSLADKIVPALGIIIPAALGLLAGRATFLRMETTEHTNLVRTALVASCVFVLVFLIINKAIDSIWVKYKTYALTKEKIDAVVRQVVDTDQHAWKELIPGCFLIRNKLGVYNDSGQTVTTPPFVILVERRDVPEWVIQHTAKGLTGGYEIIRSNYQIAPRENQVDWAIDSIKHQETKRMLHNLFVFIKAKRKASDTVSVLYKEQKYDISGVTSAQGVTTVKLPSGCPPEITHLVSLMVIYTPDTVLAE